MRLEKVDELKALLGSWREPDSAPTATVRNSSAVDGVVTEPLWLSVQQEDDVPGIVCRPEEATGPLPAIVYIHAHGYRHTIGCQELVEGRPALADPPYGQVLAQNGYLAICIDLPTFGARANLAEGPTSKARLWYGATLFGDMLSDLAATVSYVASRPDVDAARIGALGLSMGGTLAYWLAALDERVAAVAQLCVFASLRELVATGSHDLHGHYMTVPGLLERFDSGDIAGLVAPRPQFVGVGILDPLTPIAAVERAWDELSSAYESIDAEGNLDLMIEPQSGHLETPRMRAAVMRFLETYLPRN